MTLYKKLFENMLEKPADPVVDAAQDAQTFENGFENEQDFANLEQETEKITLSPEEIDAIVKRGQTYKLKIDSFINVLNKIQADVVAGLFKSVESKDMAKFAPVVKDLMNLGVALTSGVGDTIIKNKTDDKKKQPAV